MPTPNGGALGAEAVRPPSGEPMLDELLAEPIVQQLMRSDRTDEAAIRHLLHETAVRFFVQRLSGSDQANETTIGDLLHKIARQWHHLLDREVRAEVPGLTHARYIVLIHLARYAAVNQAALAQALDIRSSTLVRLLDRLEASGFVARMPDPDDCRANVLGLTAKALPIIEHIYELTRKIDDDLQLGISKAEANQLRALLCRIQSILAGRLGEFPSSEPIRTRNHA